MTTNQNKITFIQKGIEDVHLTWFEHSETFVLLRKPANDVLRLFTKGVPLSEIIEHCLNEYADIEENIPQFVNNIIEQIDALNQLKPPKTAITPKLPWGYSFFPKNYLKTIYLFGKQQLTFYYGNKQLKELVHPLFSHLATNKNTKSNYRIELIEKDDLLIFKCNKKTIETFPRHESMYFKGAILKYLYSILHDKNYNNWMMTLHASGIVSNNKAVLFSADAGSGKSTLAALLHASGYELLSDDFIAADEKALVYPFPSAISVKEGSVDVLSKHYPELSDKPATLASTGKQVRYLENREKVKKPGHGFRIKAIVFLSYKSDTKIICKSLNKSEAIPLLLKEIWVNPKSNNVTHFFEWINKCSFYKMEYSDHQDAIKCISKIFES